MPTRNINSFAENMKRVMVTHNNQFNLLNSIQESLLTDADRVQSVITDSETLEQYNMELPSLTAVSRRLDAVQESVSTLMEGKGALRVGDNVGSAFSVRLTTPATAPTRITGVVNPTTFGIDPNWWFEDLMYPRAMVRLDLKGTIDDFSEKVEVDRIILPYNTDNLTFYNQNIVGTTVSRSTLLTLLNESGIRYSEDRDIVSLPPSYPGYEGDFGITNASVTVEGTREVKWYTLDGFTYRRVNEETGLTQDTIALKAGDMLANSSYLYVIDDVNVSEMKVALTPIMGYSLPKVGDSLRLYTEPYVRKYVDVKFSNDEIDIVYFRGISVEGQVVAPQWSEPVYFVTNDLVYEGNNSTTFDSYYQTNIVDWGKKLIGEIKEGRVGAYEGLKPNAPFLISGNFKVVQINTQVNASLDTDEIRKAVQSMQTAKSRVASLRNAITAQQTKLQSTSSVSEKKKIQDAIETNTKELASANQSYSTIILNARELIDETDAVDISPKYRVRGFFDIPDPRQNGVRSEQVIGFDIAYRYLKPDTTGTDLKTYTFTSADGTVQTGVYTDWVEVRSSLLRKVYDTDTDSYVWETKSESDGTVVNINQVDIPITKGEKVEFKVRSISEAGYPYSPLISDWSNSIVVDFPSNLSTSSEIQNLVKDINDATAVQTVSNEMDNAGVYTHLDDSVANINSATNVYFKHQAKNIAVDYRNSQGVVTTVSLQSLLDAICDSVGRGTIDTHLK